MRVSILAIAVLVSPVAAHADVDGVWRSERSSKGGFMDVQFYKCGEAVCGKLKTAYRKTGEVNPSFPGVGQTLIKNMVSADGENFKDGTLKNPENGKVYYSKMQMSGNNLKVSGCIAGGLLCNKINFTKMK